MRILADENGDLDVTILIVSYNTRDMTVECIHSVLKQTSAIRYEVIIVDNASTDGSVEAIRTNFPNIKLIASAENLGYGRANNLAAMHARGRRILLLNPDTVILDHAIDNLHEVALTNPECRIWGGRTVFSDGALNSQSCWRRMTLWTVFCNVVALNRLQGSRLFNSEGYGGWKRDTVRAVDIVVGCFLLIDRDLWEQLHGFDPKFFMYGEEADLCLRARLIGARPMITPAATVIHYGGASERDESDKLIKLLASKITLMKCHWSALSSFAGRLLYLMLPITRWVVLGILGALLGRADFQHKAQIWREVLRSRQRWFNGWNDVGATSARDGLSPSALDPGFDRKNTGSSVSPTITKSKSTWREIVIVVYHHIGDDEDALARHLGVTTSPDIFDKQVRYFGKNFDFVSGSELITGVLPRKALLVTFDDAFRSVPAVAGPILKAACAPSIFFVSPCTLISDYLPIDNVLSFAVEELGWKQVLSILNIDRTAITSIPQLLANIISRRNQAQIEAMKYRLFSKMGATEAEIRRATNIFLGSKDIAELSHLHMEIGNHSLHHTFFRSLSQDELETEIIKSRTILQNLSGQRVPYLAIPYGSKLDATERVLELARTSGHKATFLVHAKSNRFRMASDIFYRTHVGNALPQSLSFLLKVMPLMRSIRDAYSS